MIFSVEDRRCFPYGYLPLKRSWKDCYIPPISNLWYFPRKDCWQNLFFEGPSFCQGNSLDQPLKGIPRVKCWRIETQNDGIIWSRRYIWHHLGKPLVKCRRAVRWFLRKTSPWLFRLYSGLYCTTLCYGVSYIPTGICIKQPGFNWKQFLGSFRSSGVV